MEHQAIRRRAVYPATILVVEDDVFIRMSAAELLRDYGWDVIEADCADAAVAHLEADTTVALVFSDIQMPGSMDGVGLARWVRDNRPDVRVMLTSGAVRNVEPGLCEGALISKPYIPDAIVERITCLIGPAT